MGSLLFSSTLTIQNSLAEWSAEDTFRKAESLRQRSRKELRETPELWAEGQRSTKSVNGAALDMTEPRRIRFPGSQGSVIPRRKESSPGGNGVSRPAPAV